MQKFNQIDRNTLTAPAYGIITFGLLILTFAFCALRTNIIFVITFLVADVAIFLLAASYWSSGVGAMDTAHELQKASGGMLFICCVLAWYLLVANLLEVLEFGWSLPVGDLSGKMGRQMGKGEYRDRSRSV
jgi:succinate-acetate transporter protein